MDEMWQLYMAMGTVLAAVVTAMAFGWRVSSAMRKENSEAHAGIRTEIQTVREDLGAEIAENRAEIGGVRRELGTEIASVRTDLAAEIVGVRKELGAEIAENREAIGGLRGDLGAEIVGVRRELGAEIAENREAIGGLREDLAAFRGHMDAKIDAHGARIDLLEARVAKTGEDVAFIKGLLTGGDQD